MGILATRFRARNSNSLPLFDWAERQAVFRQSPLAITARLSRRFKTPSATLDAWAAANGFTFEGERHEV